MGQRRYPGAAPFRSDQARIFYGRDRDKKKLLTLIQVEKKVLLYSKSGLGKTSLLEAGVIPELPGNYFPISIRLFAYSKGAVSPVQRVIHALQKAVGELNQLPETILDKLSDDSPKDTLWFYFKKLQLAALSNDTDEPPKIYLLVLDQFEELFSYPANQIEEFKNQFYELTEVRVPQAITLSLARARRQNRDLFNEEILNELNKETSVKTVFAIRSDRLSLLNRLSDKIRDIQSVFYEIKPLDNEQAKQAVVKPAGDPDEGFETRPFRFSSEAIEKIIVELSDNGTQNIETTQLQIVCSRIEEIADNKRWDINAGELIPIEVEDLPEFKNIFLNFYNDSINKIPVEARPNAKRLVEDELIRNKQRISLDEEICKENVSDKNLQKLVDTHLLRAERNSFGRFSYELSHDTLVEPILESQKEYRREQERIRLEMERQEELQKLREKQVLEREEREKELRDIQEKQRQKEVERLRKMKRQRTFTITVLIFLAISIGAVVWALISRSDAKEKQALAIQKEQEANEALQDFRKSQFDLNFTNGKIFQKNTKYREAIEKYQIALQFDSVLSKPEYRFLNDFEYLSSGNEAGKLEDYLQTLDGINFPNKESVLNKIDSCRHSMENKDEYNRIMLEANELWRRKEYVEAMKKYIEADNTDYNPDEISEIIDKKKVAALKEWEKDIDDFEKINDYELIEITENKRNALIRIYNNYKR
jgi:hypothetical protein